MFLRTTCPQHSCIIKMLTSRRIQFLHWRLFRQFVGKHIHGSAKFANEPRICNAHASFGGASISLTMKEPFEKLSVLKGQAPGFNNTPNLNTIFGGRRSLIRNKGNNPPSMGNSQHIHWDLVMILGSSVTGIFPDNTLPRDQEHFKSR